MDSQGKKNLFFIFVIALLLYGIVSAIYDGSVEAQTTCENTIVKGVLRNLIYNYLSYGETFEGTNITLDKIKGLLTIYKASSQLAMFSCLGYESIIPEAGNLSLRPPKCSDGTYYGECSSTKPMYCYGYEGQLVPRCRLCGCPTGQWCDEPFVYEEKNNLGQWGKCYPLTCNSDSDCGTAGYIREYYCQNGDVYKNYTSYTCSNPGTKNSTCTSETTAKMIDDCGTGEECTGGQDECQKICSDGTSSGQCSTMKPKYCDNGILVNNCNVCGCPTGETCQANSCIATACGEVVKSFEVKIVGVSSSEPPGMDFGKGYLWVGDGESYIHRLNYSNGAILASYNAYCKYCYYPGTSYISGIDYYEPEDIVYIAYYNLPNIACFKVNQDSITLISGCEKSFSFLIEDMTLDSNGYMWINRIFDFSDRSGRTDYTSIFKLSVPSWTAISEYSSYMITKLKGITWDGKNFWISEDNGDMIYKINQSKMISLGGSFSDYIISKFKSPSGSAVRLGWEDPSYIWGANSTTIFKMDISNCKDYCITDMTLFGECSVTKPKYCQDGSLIDNCKVCDCGTGYVCLDSGICQPICSDGTFYGNCSVTKPKYCQDGTLVDNCQICGCPEGKNCQIDGGCPGVK